MTHWPLAIVIEHRQVSEMMHFRRWTERSWEHSRFSQFSNWILFVVNASSLRVASTNMYSCSAYTNATYHFHLNAKQTQASRSPSTGPWIERCALVWSLTLLDIHRPPTARPTAQQYFCIFFFLFFSFDSHSHLRAHTHTSASGIHTSWRVATILMHEKCIVVECWFSRRTASRHWLCSFCAFFCVEFFAEEVMHCQ